MLKTLSETTQGNAVSQDILGELEFIAAIKQGLSELEKGDVVSFEEVERELPSWTIHLESSVHCQRS